MAEGLSTLDGTPVDVDSSEAAFAAAMAAPAADKPGHAAPPRRPAEPPADPQEAPHGWTWIGGQWRPKKAPGRPRGDGEKPRVTDAPPKTAAPSADKATSKVDYRTTLRETCEAAWFVLAAVPVPDTAFGYQLAGVRTRLRVQAALIEANVDNIAAGLNTIGQHNRFMGRALARLAAGEAGLWVLPACMLLAPFVAQTGQLWAGELADAEQLATIAAQTEANAAAYVQRLAEAAVSEAATAATA